MVTGGSLSVSCFKQDVKSVRGLIVLLLLILCLTTIEKCCGYYYTMNTVGTFTSGTTLYQMDKSKFFANRFYVATSGGLQYFTVSSGVANPSNSYVYSGGFQTTSMANVVVRSTSSSKDDVFSGTINTSTWRYGSIASSTTTGNSLTSCGVIVAGVKLDASSTTFSVIGNGVVGTLTMTTGGSASCSAVTSFTGVSGTSTTPSTDGTGSAATVYSSGTHDITKNSTSGVSMRKFI